MSTYLHDEAAFPEASLSREVLVVAPDEATALQRRLDNVLGTAPDGPDYLPPSGPVRIALEEDVLLELWSLLIDCERSPSEDCLLAKVSNLLAATVIGRLYEGRAVGLRL